MPDEHKIIFSKNLNYFMQLHDKKQADIIDDLHLNSSTISNWCKGIMMPRMDKVQLLADYFSINVSELLEDKNDIHDDISHSDEYTRLTNLCNIQFKSVMMWSEDSFYKEYETIVIREHISDLLSRYKKTLEILNGSKTYWNHGKNELLQYYRNRNSELSEKDIKKMLLKDELTSSLEDMAAWINCLPEWIARKEEEYENNNNFSEEERERLFATSAAHKIKEKIKEKN